MRSSQSFRQPQESLAASSFRLLNVNTCSIIAISPALAAHSSIQYVSGGRGTLILSAPSSVCHFPLSAPSFPSPKSFANILEVLDVLSVVLGVVLDIQPVVLDIQPVVLFPCSVFFLLLPTFSAML